MKLNLNKSRKKGRKYIISLCMSEIVEHTERIIMEPVLLH